MQPESAISYTATTSVPEIKKSNVSSSAPAEEAKISIPAAIFVSTADRGALITPYKNPRTGAIVSFSESAEQSRNPVYDIEVNGKMIGNLTGYLRDNPLFSPNSSYFSFASYSVCGANCGSFSIKVIDLANKKITNIKSPYPDLPTLTGNGVIDSYKWDADSTGVMVIAYKAEEASNSYGYVRTTPKEVWHYDLKSDTYSKVKDLPE